MTDQNGRQISLNSLKGYTILLNFIFTQCRSVCPLQTRELVNLAKVIPLQIKKQVRFVSVSVDAEHDTPQQLKTYARKVGADLPHWLFLTGSLDEITQVATAFQAVDPKAKNPGPADHSTTLYLFDRHGRMMQRYQGAPVDVARLAREIPELVRLGAAH